MAIAKLNHGNGFGGVLSYAMEKEEAEFIASAGVSNQEPEQMGREMRAVAGDRLKEPVLHVQLALPHGEDLTKEKWQEVGESWMKSFGADPTNYQHVMVRHKDRDHDHMHIIINRIGLDGRVISDSHERRRSHQAMRVAEQQTGISQYHAKEKSQRGMMAELRQKIDWALDGRPNLEQFKTKLQQAGVEVRLNQSLSTGRISGLAFAGSRGKQVKGSSLGKDYSLAGLQRRGLEIGQAPVKTQKNQQTKGAVPRSQRQNLNMVTGHAERQRAEGEKWKAERAQAEHEDERRKKMAVQLNEDEEELE